MVELVAIGEVLGTLSGVRPGPLSNGAQLTLAVAGAEATVLIAASRLGHSTAWLGRMAEDTVGRVIVSTLQAQGVSAAGVRWDSGCASSLLLKHPRTADSVQVDYFRSHGPGSRLDVGDIDRDVLAGARMLHLTGITPGLSESAHNTVVASLEFAREHSVQVSFDINYRHRVWKDKPARALLHQLAARADVVFGGAEEFELIGVDSPEDLLTLGVREVVLKDGANGATTITAAGSWSLPALPVTVVDPVGAGDAFVGGYLAALLEGQPETDRLRQGITLGAFAVSTLGDWEGLPTAQEIRALNLAADVVR